MSTFKNVIVTLINNLGLLGGFVITLCVVIICTWHAIDHVFNKDGIYAGTSVRSKIVTTMVNLMISASVIFVFLGQFVPQMKITKGILEKETATAMMKIKIAEAPFVFAESTTKVVTVERQYRSIMFSSLISVEFMTEDGYVYKRNISMEKAEWENSQIALYHQLMRAHQSGEQIKVKYKYKDLDPERHVVSISSAEGKLLWAVE